jgi:hypothetical protein
MTVSSLDDYTQHATGESIELHALVPPAALLHIPAKHSIDDGNGDALTTVTLTIIIQLDLYT